MPAVNMGETEYFLNQEGSYYDAMSSIWENMTVIKRREVIYGIDCFTVETPYGKYSWKLFFLYLICFVPIDQTPKIKICHMVVS